MFFQDDSKEVTLKCIDENLLKAGESIQEINEDREHCLKQFIECRELVTWLQDSLKGLSNVLHLITYLIEHYINMPAIKYI